MWYVVDVAVGLSVAGRPRVYADSNNNNNENYGRTLSSWSFIYAA